MPDRYVDVRTHRTALNELFAERRAHVIGCCTRNFLSEFSHHTLEVKSGRTGFRSEIDAEPLEEGCDGDRNGCLSPRKTDSVQMPWNALANRILAGSKRKKEIKVENQSDYDQWLSELYSEIEVFVKRVNALKLDESEQRDKFYEFVSRFSDRLKDLRERSEASGAPADALIRLEELIEVMNESSSKVHVSVAYIGDDPFEKARREKKREEREQEKIERMREKRDEIADQIEEVTEVFEEDDS